MTSKYGNIRKEIDGIVFASEKEAHRYEELKIMCRAGEIEGLEVQHRFTLRIGDKKVCDYIADFTYVKDGKVVVEDVKGMRTPVYRLKKKLFEALGGTIVEI